MVTRNKSMDIAKALGIILVVIGHSSSPFTNFIYLFHMPLFFFISGYFYKDKYSDAPIKLMLKRLKTLYLPFVIYQTIFLILHNLFLKINIYSNNIYYANKSINQYNQVIQPYSFLQYIKSFAHILYFDRSEQLAGAFWFFVTLFIINIGFCLISFCIKRVVKGNKNQEIVRGTLVVISFILGNICAHLNIHTGKKIEVAFVVLLFFYTGYLYKKYGNKIKIKLSACIICFILLIISSFYGTLSISTNENVNPIFLLYNSFAGIYLVICISKYISNKYKASFLNYIGNSTVSILCLHFLAFKLVNLIQVLLYNYPGYRVASYPILISNNSWWILYSVIGILMPLIAQKYIVDRVKKLYCKIMAIHKPQNKPIL